MKFSYTLLSLGLLTLSSIADAVDVSGVEKKQVWAYGVTEESGWYDYAKVRGDSYEYDDAQMCWAASAANIIAWWQNHNKEAVATLPLLPEDPWDTFRIVWDDGGGYIDYALNWYINGIIDQNGYALTLPEGYDPDVSYDGKENKLTDYRYGSFLNPFGNSAQSVYSTEENPIQLVNGSSNGYAVCGTIIDALSSGYALGLSAFSYAGNHTIAHAITLWGVEYTGSGDERALTKIWVTDSDVQDNTLQSFDIIVKENSVAIDAPDSNYMGGAEIIRVDGMRTAMPVPEPASATLSLLALAALVSRRRR